MNGSFRREEETETQHRLIRWPNPIIQDHNPIPNPNTEIITRKSEDQKQKQGQIQKARSFIYVWSKESAGAFERRRTVKWI